MTKIQIIKKIRKTRKAISLYELLIVMSIIVLVTAITIPTLNAYLPSLKLSSSGRAVSNKLRQAQEEAVTTQIRHGVRFNPTTPVTIDFIKFGTTTPLETVTLGNGITLTISLPIMMNQNTIFFSPDGGPDVHGNITVGLTDYSPTKTISVSPAGVIKLQ